MHHVEPRWALARELWDIDREHGVEWGLDRGRGSGLGSIDGQRVCEL
jgi:hypothetical protein